MAKETPNYDDFTKALNTLKQHFSFNKTKVKILDDPAMFAKKVNKHDAELHQMIKDMQSRIDKFRHDISAVETEVRE